jgi:hypothetical protein
VFYGSMAILETEPAASIYRLGGELFCVDAAGETRPRSRDHGTGPAVLRSPLSFF